VLLLTEQDNTALEVVIAQRFSGLRASQTAANDDYRARPCYDGCSVLPRGTRDDHFCPVDARRHRNVRRKTPATFRVQRLPIRLPR
jgi:hypothetical protein